MSTTGTNTALAYLQSTPPPTVITHLRQTHLHTNHNNQPSTSLSTSLAALAPLTFPWCDPAGPMPVPLPSTAPDPSEAFVNDDTLFTASTSSTEKHHHDQNQNQEHKPHIGFLSEPFEECEIVLNRPKEGGVLIPEKKILYLPFDTRVTREVALEDYVGVWECVNAYGTYPAGVFEDARGVVVHVAEDGGGVAWESQQTRCHRILPGTEENETPEYEYVLRKESTRTRGYSIMLTKSMFAPSDFLVPYTCLLSTGIHRGEHSHQCSWRVVAQIPVAMILRKMTVAKEPTTANASACADRVGDEVVDGDGDQVMKGAPDDGGDRNGNDESPVFAIASYARALMKNGDKGDFIRRDLLWSQALSPTGLTPSEWKVSGVRANGHVILSNKDFRYVYIVGIPQPGTVGFVDSVFTDSTPPPDADIWVDATSYIRTDTLIKAPEGPYQTSTLIDWETGSSIPNSKFRDHGLHPNGTTTQMFESVYAFNQFVSSRDIRFLANGSIAHNIGRHTRAYVNNNDFVAEIITDPGPGILGPRTTSLVLTRIRDKKTIFSVPITNLRGTQHLHQPV
ncbi:hypothetical protein HDV00_012697 [Rhizophlyctis rosea]|nr:hypothetical protein HDV00_012697 [Rhizophlyctis rosea]